MILAFYGLKVRQTASKAGFKVGDVIQVFTVEQIARSLESAGAAKSS